MFTLMVVVLVAVTSLWLGVTATLVCRSSAARQLPELDDEFHARR